MTRRYFLYAGSTVLLRAEAQPIRALTFDVFGTVTDWRSAIIRDGAELSRKNGFQLDWSSFAERWRAGYWEEMDRVRRGEIPWVKLDALHRHTLDRLLRGFKCDQLTEPEKQWLNLVWRRLPAWPGVKPALARLRPRAAAHFDDLEGAHGTGLRTAYVHRPKEYAPGYKMPPRPAFTFDFEVQDLAELCQRLGV